MSSTLSGLTATATAIADADLMYIDVGPGTDKKIAGSDLKTVMAAQAPVQSVASRTGAVTLTFADVGARQKLTANLTLNVASGNATPLNNLLNAWNYVCSSIDIAGFVVTIDGGSHTFTDSINIPTAVPATPTGGGQIVFQNLTWNAGAGPAFRCYAPISSSLKFANVTGSNTTNTNSLSVFDFNACAAIMSGVSSSGTGSGCAFISAGPAGNVYIDPTAWSVSGTVGYVLQQNRGGYMYVDSAAVTGSSVAMTAFARSYLGGALETYGLTYSGTFTGKHYEIDLNAVINTFGGGASYFPGSTSGTSGSGIYA
jgi:hypothetical protein